MIDSRQRCTVKATEEKTETEQPAAQKINWGDFRDHLATADQQGNRMWLYPKKPKGRYYLARLYFSFVLIVVMFAGPFVKLSGQSPPHDQHHRAQVLRARVIFWPQDNLIFAFGFLLFLTGIAVFTAAFGRLWCGWTCPQTVMMEMVFRRLEYFIEGDSYAQRALDKAPWSATKLFKKLAKHTVFSRAVLRDRQYASRLHHRH